MASNQYQTVTDRIIAMLEAGTRPWAKSWKPGEPISGGLVRPLSGISGKPYSGVNVINLWCAAQERGFRSRYWFTYKGAQELGAQVRKGAKSELAFYVGKHTVKGEAPSEGADPAERVVSFLRAYHVFNADEIEGLPERFYAPELEPAAVVDGRIAEADAFIAATGASIAHGGDRAYFMPSLDAIRVPHLHQFESPEAYYATLLHELVHFTGVEARCNRTLGKRFGDMEYAAEELVAEMGAAFLCADLAISAEPRADHADYLAGWIKILKADNRAIFTAAAAAEKAATWLHAQQPATAEALEVEQLAA
jgi:antirestriction protein ArdC